jgi:PIN domain nuclease of toxin-antitoxin system
MYISSKKKGSDGDPADQIIAATTMHYHAKLITSDSKLASIAQLEVIW